MPHSTGAPLLSIAVPTRNRAGYLRACLESIVSQAGTPFEVIICDNASTDGTPDVLQAFMGATSPWLKRITIHRQVRNVGMVGNWNACLERMSGDVGVILSDDDLVHPGFAERMSSLLRTSGGMIAFCQSRIINADGGRLPGHPFARLSGGTVPSADFIRMTLKGALVVFPSAVLFSVSEARRSGGFLDIGNVTDVEFRLRLASCTSAVAYLEEELVDYRVHPAALTRNRKLADRVIIEMSRLRRRYRCALREDQVPWCWWMVAKYYLKGVPGLDAFVRRFRRL